MPQSILERIVNDQPRVIASISDYPGLIAAMRTRAAERKIAISSDNSADLAGLPDRYIAKLLGPKPVKRIGMISLGPLLGLLGVRLVMVEDQKAIEALAGRLMERNESCVRTGAVHIELSYRFLKKIGAIGGRASANSRTPAQRSRAARKAAKARWAKPAPVKGARLNKIAARCVAQSKIIKEIQPDDTIARVVQP